MNFAFIKAQVTLLAEDEFAQESIEKLLQKMEQVLGSEFQITDYLFQISRDYGVELEAGLFDDLYIYDFTLSQNEIYFCKQTLASIHETEFFINKYKSTLKIYGEKKLDYNVLMPETPDQLLRYQSSIKQAIAKV